jgi:ribosomal protein S18 acetylase RimI-like enzyme
MLYKITANDISPDMLEGFFVNWLNSPNPQTHLKLLNQSDQRVIAIDQNTNKVVGFVTAITDGVLSAYIPFLEVLPEYQNQGIGKELFRRILNELQDFYMIDLMCDVDLQSYYEQFGMIKSTGMIIRNHNFQSGK